MNKQEKQLHRDKWVVSGVIIGAIVLAILGILYDVTKAAPALLTNNQIIGLVIGDFNQLTGRSPSTLDLGRLSITAQVYSSNAYGCSRIGVVYQAGTYKAYEIRFVYEGLNVEYRVLPDSSVKLCRLMLPRQAYL